MAQRSALSVTEAALARIKSLDPKLNAFTDVVAERARATARALDRARGEGQPLGPLAGVPFAVKNLFDVNGLADARRLQDQPRPRRRPRATRR